VLEVKLAFPKGGDLLEAVEKLTGRLKVVEVSGGMAEASSTARGLALMRRTPITYLTHASDLHQQTSVTYSQSVGFGIQWLMAWEVCMVLWHGCTATRADSMSFCFFRFGCWVERFACSRV
jgi:hypothetical protein